MQAPAAANDEARRLEALRRYAVLDTQPERALDDLVALAGQICSAPISLLSLVDEDRQWFKSNNGMPTSETPRGISFCGHAILQPDLFIVPDAAQDRRFADNPLVTGEPHVRFYAGAPLMTAGGDALGTLCVMDQVPRQLAPTEQDALRVLSRQIMAQLELRRQTRELVGREAQLRLVTDSARVGLVLVNTDRRYEYANAAYAEILGLPSPDIVGRRVADVLPVSYETQIRPRLDRAFAGERVVYELRAPGSNGERQFAVRYEPQSTDGTVGLVVVVITDITEIRRTEGLTSRLAAIVESSGDAIIGMTLDGTITTWNRSAETVFGYTAPDMMGTSIMRLVPADRQDEERLNLANIGRGEPVKNFETRRLTRDARVIDVALTMSPIRDATGTPIGASKTLRDITEAKRAEATVLNASGHAARNRRTTVRLELGILAAVAVAVFVLGARFDWFEGVSQWVQDHEVKQLDEIILVGIALTLGLSVFAVRRWREAETDLTSGQQVRAALTLLHDELDRRVKERTAEVSSANEALRAEIAERKRAEAALLEREGQLRASEALYRTIFEYAPDGIVISDPNGRYLDVNSRMCHMLAYTPEEFLQLTAQDILAPDEVRHIGLATREIATTSSYQREWKFRRKDGSGFPADVIATLLPNGNRLAMIRDVTERNQAVEALRTAEERMRFALESAHIGLWDMDYTTGILKWSDVLEAQYGVEPGTFAGTLDAFMGRVHPDDRAAVLDTVQQAMQSGTDFTTLHRALQPNGKARWLSGAGRVRLDAQGRPVRGVGISMDVTERRVLEEQYQQAQKMEAVGRLAGGVAHDFNNLLTAILGYCGLLLEDFSPEDPRRADVTEIQSAGRSAASLTRQLLAFSRKQIIEPTLLDLNAIVTNMRGMLGRVIGEDIDVVLRLGSQPARVKADHGQMEQVLMNLAVNARDAMPNGGSLTIETAAVELDENYAAMHFSVKPGSYVALTITDTGSGMTPEVQARLFEPFFTTKGVGKGTGLGLATVHGIVAHSGGSVNVYSEIGRGTSFKVYLPSATPEDAMTVAPAPVERPATGTQTILVVDDAEGLRALAKRLLVRQGYTVLTAANAKEAVRLFEDNPAIEVLLTDVVMPGASGPELTQQLVERRPALRVIYMSGYTEDAIVHRGVLDPGVAFLHKPFTADTLGRKIREVLDR